MGRGYVMLVSWLVAVALIWITKTEGFTFDLPANSKRCFTEEVPSETELRISYAALPGYAQFIDAYVVDPKGKVIMTAMAQDHGNVFEHVTSGGEYTVCLTSRLAQGVVLTNGMNRSVTVDIRIGEERHDYVNLATKEKLRPIEVELRVLEDTVRFIHTEYLYYKEKEAEMRDRNESVTLKVVIFTVLLVVVFVAFSLWELMHLKKYFRKKRLID
ncbi:putative COP-coated vesicle membrane protein gp25L precursor [Trypanosoma vivax]|nr:putative COP-coated vesicle membrane protein gp25L precursor [Trypanosoma vivax]